LTLFFDKFNIYVAPKGLFNFPALGYKDNAPPGLVVSFISLPAIISACLVLACPA
jgi:hypothetical protein